MNRTTLLCLVVGTTLSTQINAFAKPYPQGREFPLGLYSINPGPEMERLKREGWNLFQNYGGSETFYSAADRTGVQTLAGIAGAGQTGTTLRARLSDRNVAWWGFPEELRFWIPGELSLLRSLRNQTQRQDPLNRPTYMYIAGHFSEEAVAQYLPYLDILPTGFYSKHQSQPHSWIRWRGESLIRAIERNGFRVGRNFRRNERVPVAVLELFRTSVGRGIIGAKGARHDFWQSLLTGVKGLFIFSHFRREDHPKLTKAWRAYQKAQSEFIDPRDRLDQVFLFGSLRRVPNQIISGPSRTPEFTAEGRRLSFDSVDSKLVQRGRKRYLFLVNSSNSRVRVRVTGLNARRSRAPQLFGKRRKGRIKNQVLTTAISGLGVKAFRIR